VPSIHLLADLGATNSRFGIVSTGGRVRHVRIFPADSFQTPLAAVHHYLAQLPASDQPHDAAFAVAAPIVSGRVTFVNRGWSFPIEGLRKSLGLSQLLVLNDLEAQAFALLNLAPGDWRKVGRGRTVSGAPMLAVGPGTGLGMAALLPDETRVIAGEGGHATLSAVDPGDLRVLASLRRRFGHASAERALSGPGLSALYRALSRSGRHTLTPAEVAHSARTRSDSVAVAATQVFSRLLGGFCGDMALAFGALGGVYVVGGVVPGLGRAFDRRSFRAAFEAKGRYRDYLARVPVFLVTRKDLGLRGLATYLRLRRVAPARS
jgi:glucokinase